MSVLAQDLALVLSRDEEQDLARLEHARQAACQSLARYVALLAPVAGVAADARGRERHEACGRVALDGRLVEAEVPVGAEAEHREVGASARLDGRVVAAAGDVGREARRRNGSCAPAARRAARERSSPSSRRAIGDHPARGPRTRRAARCAPARCRARRAGTALPARGRRPSACRRSRAAAAHRAWRMVAAIASAAAWLSAA